MKLEQQVTSLDLSKTLKELGVKQESLYAWSEPNDKKIQGSFERAARESIQTGIYDGESDWGECFDKYSAFTVAELGEILPWDIVIQRSIQKDWILTYKPNGRHEGGVTGFQGVREAETRGRMLEYLIKNNLLSV